MDRMRMESVNRTEQNIEKIRDLFPNCVTEILDEERSTPHERVYRKAVNFDLLKQMLSDEVIAGPETFEFTWVGKRNAIVEANKPIRKTLRPCYAESLNWEETGNLYLEGDNLAVLKLLQESYLGKVKMIYIDPPYNTGHDFVYPDSYVMEGVEYDERSGYCDANGNINYQREHSASSGRFHSDWCSMIYARLLLARNLLREDGVIFLSIDDKELDDLMKIGNELFGKDNFLACFPRVTKKAGKSSEAIARNHDYVLAYSKSVSPALFLPVHTDEGFRYSDEYEEERGKYKLNQTLDYDSLQYSVSLDYPITIEGETFYPGGSYEKHLARRNGGHARADWAWRWSEELFRFGREHGFIVVKKYDGHSRIYTKTYERCRIVRNGGSFTLEYRQRRKPISTLEFVANEYSNDNSKKNLVQLFGSGVFDYSKPVSLLKMLVQYATQKDDIVLDFFAGSATTAHAVMQRNAEDGGKRKFIMVQIPEPCAENSDAYKSGYSNICEIGKERIRRAGRKLKAEYPLAAQELDVGFRVLKLDEGNRKDGYYNPVQYSQEMLALLESNIKEDRTDMDLLFGCLLSFGLPLHLPHTSVYMEECTIHTYNDGELVACFQEKIPDSVIRKIAEQKPRRVVFRDSGFADSSSKINAEELFRMLAPDTRMRVI